MIGFFRRKPKAEPGLEWIRVGGALNAKIGTFNIWIRPKSGQFYWFICEAGCETAASGYARLLGEAKKRAIAAVKSQPDVLGEAMAQEGQE